MPDFVKKHRDFFLFIAVFLLIMAKYCCCGFQYWPQLDDYIQYHNYAAYSDSLVGVAKALGVLAARPLAGLADIFFWSLFFDHMLAGAALVSLMYAGAAVLLRRIFSSYFGTGILFVVLFSLLPLGTEGTYWMSASTRIVTGLFFAAVSASFFIRWLRQNRRPALNAVLYAAFQLLAFGFYEQALVFSVALTILVALLEYRTAGRRVLLGLWSFAAAGIYFTFTAIFSESLLYAGRTELVLPVSRYYWDTFLPELLCQLKCAFLEGGFYTLVKGFVRGLRLIFSGEFVLWAIAAVLLCVLLWLLSRGEGGAPISRIWSGLAVGLLLALAPLAPFFVTANTWFSLRGTVMSFAGLALIGDILLRYVLSRLLPGKDAAPLLAAGLALLFLVAGAVEIRDYRDTCRNDVRVAGAVLDALDETAADLQIGILNIEASYLSNQNYYYHEHIHGVTESQWAFTGALRCLSGSNNILSVTPLPGDPMYKAWNAATSRPEVFDRLYFYDADTNSVFPVQLEKTGDHAFNVLREDGTLIAVIWEENSIGYLRVQSSENAPAI